MKKIYTLIILLLTFVLGTQTAQAYNEEEVVITGVEGDRLDPNVMAAMEATETIIAEYDDENNIQYYYSSDRKLLFTINSDNIITVASGVSSADDLICDPDNGFRQLYRIPDDVEFFELHFIQNPTKDMELTLMTGMNIEDPENEDTYMTIEALAKYSDELRCHKDEESGTSTYTTFAGKKLFSVTSDGMAFIEDNLTADDIVYTITREDRNYLRDTNKELYDYLYGIKTIEIRFAPQTENMEAILRDGTDLADEKNLQTLKVIQILVNSLNILSTGYRNGLTAIYSPSDKFLFTLTEEGIANVNQDLRVSDNIIYDITEEDRENLYYSDRDAYELLLDYKAIMLYFNYNDPDGIRDIKDSENLNDSWYTLDGRKLQGKPTQRGIYIKDGKKMLKK